MLEAKLQALRGVMRFLEEHHLEIARPVPNWIKGAKRLGELAALADGLLRGRVDRLDPQLGQHARDWMTVAWRVLRQGEFFADVIEQHASFMSLAMNYTPLRRHGYQNERLETLLATSGERVGVPSWFVSLAIACALDQLGIPSPFNVDSLIREAWCMRLGAYARPDPTQAYETTHVVMWLRDRGGIPADMRTRVLAWNPRWVDSYVLAQNVDVVAELVMMQHHLEGGCASAQTWEWLLARQAPDGSFPEMDIPSRALGRFHVTVAAGLALSSCLGGGSCHPAGLTSRRG